MDVRDFHDQYPYDVKPSFLTVVLVSLIGGPASYRVKECAKGMVLLIGR